MTSIKLSHRVQLSAWFLVLAAVLGIPASLVITQTHRAQLVDDRGAALRALARSAATVVTENLQERLRDAQSAAMSFAFVREPLDSPEIRRALDDLRLAYPLLAWLGVVDQRGIVRSASGGMLDGQDVSNRPWFKQAQGQATIGDVHEAVLLAKLLPPHPSQQPIRFFDVVIPLTDERGQPRGVLGIHANWDWADHVVSAVRGPDLKAEGIDVLIVNRQGEVIYPVSDSNDARVPVSLEVADQRSAQWVSWGSQGAYLTARAPVVEPGDSTTLGWTIVVRQPRERVLAAVGQLQRTVNVTLVATGFLLVIAAWWLAGRMSGPLRQAAVMARRIEDGEVPPAPIATNNLELQELVSSLRRMGNTLLSQQESLKVSNAQLEQRVAQRTAELELALHEVKQLARHDTLTGLLNRRAAQEFLQREFLRFRRTGHPYVAILLDIDHFKRINDTYGHPAGDEVLKRVASTLQSQIRETDLVARVGGEEFLLLLPSTPLGEGVRVAEKVRQAVCAHPIEPAGTVTISVGVAVSSTAFDDADQVVATADQRLYQAKKSGRNRVQGDSGGAQAV